MSKWELTMFTGWAHERNKGIDASLLWTVKDKDGKSAFDKVNAMAAEGWELVSVTPMDENGWTHQVLFTFKRPLES